MILVDTSVWIDHLRVANVRLIELLMDGQVLCHPFVVGELACGALKRRTEMLRLLKELPQAPAIASDDVLLFVDVHALMGRGIGWIDMHLIASAYASGHALWTRDTRLAEVARRLGVAA